MPLELGLLILLFAYVAITLLFGATKGRKYLESYSSSEEAGIDYFFHHVDVTLALAGLATTALALFVSFGLQLQNLERVSSITLFFSISFVTLALSSTLRRFPRRAYTFVSTILRDAGMLAIGCGFLAFFRQELPLSHGLTLTYGLFIVVFLILSFYQLYKYYKYWSLLDGEKKKAKKKSVKDSNLEKSGSYSQAFLLFYGAILGLSVGIWGNLWATLFFEHIIRGDKPLALHFWLNSLVLVILIATLIIAMIYFYKRR